MCAIAGLVVLGTRRVDPVAACGELAGLVLRGAVRGSDSFGVTTVGRDGSLRRWKGAAAPTAADLRGVVTAELSVALASCRAIPTTEWNPELREAAAQPLDARGWAVVHNGTVANDHELWGGLGVDGLPVDSAVLPLLFAADGFDGGLRRVQGSYALAAVDAAEPRVMHLAKNFKPLVLARTPLLPAIAFASTAKQLVPPPADGLLDLGQPRVEDFPPYSTVHVDGERGEVRCSPLDPAPARRRALVVASGGLDSTVAATLLLRQGWEVTLLHFRYGCHAQTREERAVADVAEALGCAVRYVPIDWLGRLGGSSLTTPGAELAPSEAGAELPHEWVPARNMLMIACACAIADAEGFTDVALGTNLEEGGAFPDNTQQFVEAMDAASRLGTLSRARVIAPVGNLVKHQIVRLGLDAGAPLHLTWSCYRDGTVHCGTCGPCFMRRVAFVMHDLIDPVPFAAPLQRLRPV